MKKALVLILVIVFASYAALAWQWPGFKRSSKKTAVVTKEASGTGKAAVKKSVKRTSGKFTTDKNQVRDHVILKQMNKDLTIKQDMKNVPPVDPKDIHPSQQF